MNLPILSPEAVRGKRVLVRLDLDIAGDTTRIENSKETLKLLTENSAKTIIIGHKGRPNGEAKEELSLKRLTGVLSSLIGKEVVFEGDGEIVLKENLRFDKGEEENSSDFAKELSSLGDIFVNEAFAVAHRAHASIVSLPKLLPHFAGYRFVKEVENLGKVRDNPKRPVVVILSGVKEDKVEMAKKLTQIADRVLVGGRLPKFFSDSSPPPPKMVLAELTFDGFDITLNSIARFKKEIKGAGTIVLAGVLGKYEEEGYRQGTKEVFEAVAQENAFKVAGGGDTEAALTLFDLTSKFDWISVGGGAMIELIIKGTLPGIQALLE